MTRKHPPEIVFPRVRAEVRIASVLGGYDPASSLVLDSVGPDLATLCRVVSRTSQNGLLVEGLERVLIGNTGDQQVVLDIHMPSPDTLKVLWADVVKKLTELSAAVGAKKDGDIVPPLSLGNVSEVTYTVAFALWKSFGNTVLLFSDAVDMLRESDVSLRLESLSLWIDKCIAGSRAIMEVQAAVKSDQHRQLKQGLIRRQIDALQGHLEDASDTAVFEKKYSKLCEYMDQEIRNVCLRDLHRLKSLPTHHPEYHVTANYLEQVFALPWENLKNLPNNPNNEEVSLAGCEAALDAGHLGMDSVKRKVLQLVAVDILTRKVDSEKKKNSSKSSIPAKHPTIMCLYGPPGVGKTSIVSSIARGLNRDFSRVSLAGVRDSAELRGHRRTYIGAMPGLVIQALIRAGSSDPVILIDEIDKAEGGALLVLLELLDPAQNKNFKDAYLNFPFDLSQCLFVCTCNDVGRLPMALRDRLDFVKVSGYLLEEKREICARFLLPKCVLNAGLFPNEIELSDLVISTVIEEYTCESGVRGLEKKLRDICAWAAAQHLGHASGKNYFIKISSKQQLVEILGPPLLAAGATIPSPLPVGTSLGLAVTTPTGGDVLFVESVALGKGNGGKILITGQLGEVMRESVHACVSLLIARAHLGNRDSVFGLIDPIAVRNTDVHIHFPNGAVPKDGPSAGVAVCIALASLFGGVPARSDLAATGEITLRGQVLAIGGLREKAVAADRAGLKTIVVPKENEVHANEIPKKIRKSLEIFYASSIEQVMQIAFDKDLIAEAIQSKMLSENPNPGVTLQSAL